MRSAARRTAGSTSASFFVGRMSATATVTDAPPAKAGDKAAEKTGAGEGKGEGEGKGKDAAGTTGAATAPGTAAVAGELAVALPPELAAVTATRRREPASAGATT